MEINFKKSKGTMSKLFLIKCISVNTLAAFQKIVM